MNNQDKWGLDINKVRFHFSVFNFDFVSSSKTFYVVGEYDALMYLIKKFAVPHKEQNMLDSGGNTALHLAAKDTRCSSDDRMTVVRILFEVADIDTNIRNSEGKEAILLVPRKELFLISLLQGRMRMQEGRKSIYV